MDYRSMVSDGDPLNKLVVSVWEEGEYYGGRKGKGSKRELGLAFTWRDP